jgi:two-component system, NtrC family, sensor kinase
MLHSARLAAVGQLAAGVAHNINNILTIISVNAELLGLDQAATGSQVSQDILTAVDRGEAMVKSLHALAGGNIEPVLRPVRVIDLVHSGLLLIKPKLSQHNIRVHVDVDEQIQVLADLTLIRQVMLNLVINSTHAMEAGGCLTLAARASGDLVEFDVTDTGCGIPPENLERIFTPFFTTRDSKGGTGLGLPTSLSMVKAMGGDILVRSRPGDGSTFTVRLRRAYRQTPDSIL